MVTEAANGFQNKFGDLGAEICKQRNINSRLGLQSAAVKALLPMLYPINFGAELARRLRLWIPAASILADLEIRIEETLAIADAVKSKPFVVTAVMNICCNGWTTSRRTSSPTRACIYGCAGEDCFTTSHAPSSGKRCEKVAKVAGDTDANELMNNLNEINFYKRAVGNDAVPHELLRYEAVD